MIDVLILPILVLSLMVYAFIKKVKLYDVFSIGVKGAIPLTVSIFPYLVSIFIIAELFEVSGLSDVFANCLSPFFKMLGIPDELSKLIILKPFSGSGSLALLSDIYKNYGPDSYLSRCASCIYGSSETVFYISAVYFSTIKTKSPTRIIVISLAAGFFSAIFACFICKFL